MDAATAPVLIAATNAPVTYTHIRSEGASPVAYRWIGRCKCGKAYRVDGVIGYGYRVGCGEQVVISGAMVYRTADNGSNPCVLFVSCGDHRAKLRRVFDDHRPNRPRHECNAKCLSSTGPACECKCRGANHGGNH